MTQKTTVTKTIGERSFEMFMLPPMESQALLVDTLKMVGPTAGPILDLVVGALRSGATGALSALSNIDLGSDTFSRIVREICSNLSQSTLERIEKSFARVCRVDGALLEKTFDAVFLGELGMMYEWLYWAMGVQWGKLFSVLAKGADGQGAQKEKESV